MLDKIKHHAILVEILKALYGDKEIAPYLGFKGGTAANIFYDLPRFSVDLDFDLIEFSDEIEKLVFKRVEKIAGQFGKISDGSIKFYTIYFKLNYEVGQHNIKIEISRRLTASQFELRNYLGIPINVMKAPDVFANKLLALTQRDRPVNRDVFDVHYFLQKKFPINEATILEKSGKSFAKYLPDCIKHVEALKDSQVLHSLGELVDSGQKVWIKNHMKEDTLFQLKLRLDLIKKYEK